MEALLTTPIQASPFALLAGVAVSLVVTLLKNPNTPKEVKLLLPIVLSFVVGALDAFLRGSFSAGDILGGLAVALATAQTFFTINFVQRAGEARAEAPKELPVVSTVE